LAAFIEWLGSGLINRLAVAGLLVMSLSRADKICVIFSSYQNKYIVADSPLGKWPGIDFQQNIDMSLVQAIIVKVEHFCT
jgi:hypothetical protein